MEINFFTIWFFISPFIILHLFLSRKRYRDKADVVIEHINDTWDSDYKKIINTYGSIEELLNCYNTDFNIVRNNVVKIYSYISQSNRDFMFRADMLLDIIDELDLDKEQIHKNLKEIKTQLCIDTDELLTFIRNFLDDEEKAHSDKHDIKEVLDSLDEKYKNFDLKDIGENDEEQNILE